MTFLYLKTFNFHLKVNNVDEFKQSMKDETEETNISEHIQNLLW